MTHTCVTGPRCVDISQLLGQTKLEKNKQMFACNMVQHNAMLYMICVLNMPIEHNVPLFTCIARHTYVLSNIGTIVITERQTVTVVTVQVSLNSTHGHIVFNEIGTVRIRAEWCISFWNKGRIHYNDVIMSTSQIISLTIVDSSVCSDTYLRKHQSSASLALMRRIQCFHLMTSSCELTV